MEDKLSINVSEKVLGSYFYFYFYSIIHSLLIRNNVQLMYALIYKRGTSNKWYPSGSQYSINKKDNVKILQNIQ